MSRLLTESKSLFAMDAKTGKLLWHYKAEHSIRHNAIALDGEQVCLIDRPLAIFDRDKKPKNKEHPTRFLEKLGIVNKKKKTVLQKFEKIKIYLILQLPVWV